KRKARWEMLPRCVREPFEDALVQQRGRCFRYVGFNSGVVERGIAPEALLMTVILGLEELLDRLTHAGVGISGLRVSGKRHELSGVVPVRLDDRFRVTRVGDLKEQCVPAARKPQDRN